MSDPVWEESRPRPGGRWPLVAGLAVAVVVVGALARPGAVDDGDPFVVEQVAADESDSPAPPETPTPAATPSPPATDAEREPDELPEVLGDWVELEPAPIDVPGAHHGVWTGSELIVGFESEVAAYDPTGGSWRAMPDLPDARIDPQVIWTGRQVFVFAGWGEDPDRQRADGWLLDPAAERWEAVPEAPATPGWGAAAVWTGAEVVVWGGGVPVQSEEDEFVLGPPVGSAYDPARGTWRPLPAAPVDGVFFATGLWTGREAVFWGTRQPPAGAMGEEGIPYAVAYDPVADAWRQLPAPPLEHPSAAGSVWTGSEILLWGQPPWRRLAGSEQVIGAALDPSAEGEGWRLLPEVDPTGGRATSLHGVTASWNGREALFYGGYPRSVGLLYRPDHGSWRRLPRHVARVGAVTVWTGSEFLLWGGYTTTGPEVTLAGFRPVSSTASLCRLDAQPTPPESLPAGWSWWPSPLPGVLPAALAWTGSELLLWGGGPPFTAGGEGGAALDPSTGAHRCLPPSPLTPRARAGGTRTPTGLFVWGGSPPADDGALYEAGADVWRVLPPAPLGPRLPIAAAWTGQEVLVWGGTGPTRGHSYGGGAAYDLHDGTWRELPEAPEPINQGEAVWTGDELLVLGAHLQGGNAASGPATALAYSPLRDAWRTLPPTSLSPQASSVAWTGTELVAWDYLLDAATYDPAEDRWEPLPPLPLEAAECYPKSAVVAGSVFAWHCGQAALLDPATRRWREVEVPDHLADGMVASAGDSVFVVEPRGVWRFTP